MRKICQRFCPCVSPDGYKLDPDRKQWVCGTCGLPTEGWYVGAIRQGTVPVLPRAKWGKASPVVDIDRYKRIIRKRADKAKAKVNKELSRTSTERGVRRAR